MSILKLLMSNAEAKGYKDIARQQVSAVSAAYAIHAIL